MRLALATGRNCQAPSRDDGFQKLAEKILKKVLTNDLRHAIIRYNQK